MSRGQNQTSWSAFLPSRAILMGRTARARENADSRVSASAVEVPAHAPPTGDRATLLAHALNELETRGTLVTGEGDPGAELVFVNEGPSERSASDELLDKMIVAMGLSRESVYLLNVVRSGSPDFPVGADLDLLLGILQPKVVVALGELAAQALLASDAPISELRGKLNSGSQDYKIMPTLHPAELLRNPQSKREAWSDLQAVARELGLAIPPKKG